VSGAGNERITPVSLEVESQRRKRRYHLL
jgi:hypothetical protein